MPISRGRKKMIGGIVLVFVLALFALFFYDLSPLSAQGKTAAPAAPVIFEVRQGEGFRDIVAGLYSGGLIRSRAAFDILALLGGKAFMLRPGLYRLNAGMNASEILKNIAGGNAGEATITIPEGSNIYDIDRILSNALVIRPNALINFPGIRDLEGRLFPDTYNFYTNAQVADVVAELTANFDAKAAPLLNADKGHVKNDLILASIVEKEVPGADDRKVVAGILLKRIQAGMTLNVDATVCYAKFLRLGSSAAGCYPLSSIDFQTASPYNTYLNKGLPPTPIGNPGTDAIAAVLHSKASPYWYYLSDPATGKTIFATTLDEQNQNRVKYLVK